LREEYSIGRGEENTVRLTERNISRKHAFLRRNGSGWVISDSASYNGSYVNGVRIVGDYTIAQGDIVQVGDYRLVFNDEDAIGKGDTATATTAPGAGPSAAKPDRLVVVVGPEPGQEFLIQAASIVIGRAPELDITIPHSSVSRVHAEIHALGGGRYEVIDKASANGVRVNGSLLKRGLLEAGDFIELGEVKLKFVGAGQIYRPGPEAMRLESPKEDGITQGATVRPPPPSSPVFGTTANIDGFAHDVGGRSKVVKNLFVGASLGLLVVGGFFAFRRLKPHGALSPAELGSASAAAGPTVDPARTALEEAKELAAQGDLDLAHARIASDVATSPALRDGAEVREIESRWADAVLARAEQEQDVPTRRMLLNTVAQSTTVDAGRRRTAADKLKEVDYLGTDIRELPQAAKTPSTAAPPAQNESIPSKLPKPILAADPWSTPAATPSKSRAAPATAAPPPEPPVKASELALQGPEGEAKARAQIEAKVASGRASVEELKMLRAICQHAGDRVCRDRASELLRQQK
jgi:pSer/pThr/pTyr-binding forkhead associated (FHA) protein